MASPLIPPSRGPGDVVAEAACVAVAVAVACVGAAEVASPAEVVACLAEARNPNDSVIDCLLGPPHPLSVRIRARFPLTPITNGTRSQIVVT